MAMMIFSMEGKREIDYSVKFKRDYRKSEKQGKNMALLLRVIGMLANDEPLPARYRDHALSGNWAGHRECHVMPDWLLIYKKSDDGKLELMLMRLGSHSELRF